MTGGDPDWDDPDPEDDGEDDKPKRPPTDEADSWGSSRVPEGQDGEDVLKRMARSHTDLALATLADVARNGDKDVARVAASKELLARGFGMPTRRTEQKVDVRIQDQRAAHFAALQQLAERNPALDIPDAEFDEIPNERRLPKRRDDDE